MQQKPDKRDLRYLQFVTDRINGRSDEEIADQRVGGAPADPSTGFDPLSRTDQS